MGSLSNEKARRGTPGSPNQSATEDHHKGTSGSLRAVGEHPFLLAYLLAVGVVAVVVEVAA